MAFKLPGSIINGSEIWLVTTCQAGYSSKDESILVRKIDFAGC